MTPSQKKERKEFIEAELARLYEIGRFRKEVVSLDPEKLETALMLHFTRIDAWHASRFVSTEERRRADRHKVGANTALAISEVKPLIVQPGVQTNAFESVANQYLAIKLAVSKIFSEHQEKLKVFQFPEREILMMLATMNQNSWTPKTFALDLYRMEEQYLLKYGSYIQLTAQANA